MLSEKPLLPWVTIETNGEVLARRCRCMTGLAESCFHIASLLFWTDIKVKIRDSKTVVDEKSSWLVPNRYHIKSILTLQIDITYVKTKKKNKLRLYLMEQLILQRVKT